MTHLQLAPLGEEDNVVGRLAAHVQQRLAALAHPHRVRALRVPARKSFAQTDVEESELNSLARFGTQRPPALLPAGVVFRVH